jgi:6-pyruvoyltetrahydropterin/6-carboxytetrahydropterin synthase
MKADLVKVMYFEAAHRNPRGGEAQQRLHGHSYKVELLAHGEVDPDVGWVVDYGELKQLYQPVHDLLDHSYLNELPGMAADATLPALSAWIEGRLTSSPAWLRGVRVLIRGDLAFRPVRLAADGAQGLPERIRFTFEAAQSLPCLPDGHPCRRMHGHSYLAEVATLALDGLESHIQQMYALLDHRCLNDVPDLDQATCENIAQWMWNRLAEWGEAPVLVAVQETPSARCLYWGE